MRLWAILMGLFTWYILASEGYPELGIAALALLTIYGVIPEKKPAKKEEKAKSYQEMEPIVIESKRGAPYRIPEKMKLSYKEASGKKKDWPDKAVSGIASIFKSGVKMAKDLFEE